MKLKPIYLAIFLMVSLFANAYKKESVDIVVNQQSRNMVVFTPDKAAKNIYRQPRPPELQDLMPDIRQKGVDMRIGIDITWLALRRLVDVVGVVTVTADSDFVPVFKVARREGMRVYLAMSLS